MRLHHRKQAVPLTILVVSAKDTSRISRYLKCVQFLPTWGTHFLNAHDRQGPSQRRTAASCVVLGPDGQILTPDDLPRRAPARWIAHRKAEITIALLNGLISLEDLRKRYELSFGEVLAWTTAYRTSGLAGLQCRRRTKGKISYSNISGAFDDHAEESRPLA